MTKLPVYNIKGKQLHKIDLNPDVFDNKINKPFLHQVITSYQLAKRAGCASTKTRKDVRGGGAKPWRQKGTGRARTGSIRNPIWRGGGIVFGPHPKEFTSKLTKKTKKLALKFALNAKLNDERLIIINGVELDQPKTKMLADGLKKLPAASESSVLLILDDFSQNVKRASSNIPNLSLQHCKDFTALDTLLADRVIISESALTKTCKRITNSKEL